MSARARQHRGMTVVISSRSGRVDVVAEARTDVDVKGATTSTRDGVTYVEGRSKAITVRCPVGSDVRIGVQSGRVSTRGLLGDVRITAASGAVELEAATSADVRTASGSVTVERCDGECHVSVSSGRVTVGAATSVEISTKSGSVDVGPVTDAVVRVASGNVGIAASGHGDVAVTTRSGSVTVTLPPGAHPAFDIESRGRVKRSVDEGDDGHVMVRARSGRVVVRAQ